MAEIRDVFLKDVKRDLLIAFADTIDSKMEQLKMFENALEKLDEKFYQNCSQSTRKFIEQEESENLNGTLSLRQSGRLSSTLNSSRA